MNQGSCNNLIVEIFNQRMSSTTYKSSSDNDVVIFDSLKPFDNNFPCPPLIYIHGGAWRDPSNTAHDVDELSTKLNPAIPLSSLDYRLSPQVKYPTHLEDVHAGVEKILKLTFGNTQSSKKVSLIGHSVGATLILQLLNQFPNIEVEQIYLLDGIYDLEELIREYPDYKSFVDEAHDDYTKTVRLDWSLLKKLKQVHIIHSYEDELLSLNQTKWLIKHLESEKIGYNLKVDDFGKHDSVFKHQKLADYINSTYVL